jgi:hypothetical protein
VTGGLPGRDPKTVAKNKYVLEPVLAVIGSVRLRDLDVTDVDNALTAVAATRSSSTVAAAHLALIRAITRAQAKNLVLRNVSVLTGTPPGQQGRPSRSMTLAHATAVTAAAQAAGPRTCLRHAVAVHGVRTEEARALRSERRLRRPRRRPAASVAVWRSVRARGDTKTRTSRRTLALPHLAATALLALHAEAKPGEGELVFCTATGQPLDAANVRRLFRAVCRAAGIGADWTPPGAAAHLRQPHVRRQRRSGRDRPARRPPSSKVTETVYRHQLRPVMTTGAEKMDSLLRDTG